MHEEDGSVLDECETLYVCTVTKEEQLQAVLGLVKQKDIVAVLPTGFANIFI